MKRKLSLAGLSIWRAGVAIGIGALLFLQQHYVSRREFDEYKVSHQQWGDEVLKHITYRLDSIDHKLDSIKLELVSRPKPSPMAAGAFTNSFRLLP